jgi:hypothetical protein
MAALEQVVREQARELQLLRAYHRGSHLNRRRSSSSAARRQRPRPRPQPRRRRSRSEAKRACPTSPSITAPAAASWTRGWRS